MRKLGLGLSALFLLVAAVGTYLALRPSEDAVPVVDDGGAGGSVSAAGDAPVVLAAGKRAGLPETPKGAYAIPGKVIDHAGAPVAGVRVTATRTGPSYDMEDPGSWVQATGAATTKKRLDALNAPVVGEPKADTEATTDAEGRFTVTVKEAGRTRSARSPRRRAWGRRVPRRCSRASRRPPSGCACGRAWRSRDASSTRPSVRWRVPW